MTRRTDDEYVNAVPNPIILRAEHLGRTVHDKILIQDANFELQKGEVLAITGPSGSGKTSLLRLLNRLDEPTSGTVFVEGADYRQIEPRELRRKLGMVTQRPYLFPGTVADNLLSARPSAARLATRSHRDCCPRLGSKITPGATSPIFPGGEAQRASVARTLANRRWSFCSTSPLRRWTKRPNSKSSLPSKKSGRNQGLTCVIVTHDRGPGGPGRPRALSTRIGTHCGCGWRAEEVAACLDCGSTHSQLQLVWPRLGGRVGGSGGCVLARRRRIHLEAETLIAMVRGLVQIIAVGSILVILLARSAVDQQEPAGPPGSTQQNHKDGSHGDDLY